MKKKIVFLLLILMILSLIVCSDQESEDNSQKEESSKLSIFVSILPEEYFVERIGGDLVNTNVVVGKGEDPHTYEPKPQQMKDMGQADIYFAIGIEFEKIWLPKFTNLNKDMKVIHIDKSIEKIPMAEHHHTNEHGVELNKETSPVDERRLDPHVWLSTNNAFIISDVILSTLIEEDPDNAVTYRKNHEKLVNDINELEKGIRVRLRDCKSRKFVVFHPAWGYFARDFNLEQIPVEVEGKEPSPKELAELIEYIDSMNIRIVFVSPQFSKESAKTIADNINGTTATINPLAENWMENMKRVTMLLDSVLNR
jgi:zinc transport system substrate-binding protein